jgi:tetratricopeptide (TPR) repeat protein
MAWLRRHRTRKAHKLLNKGQLARAINLLERAQAWDDLARIYAREGDLALAAETARKGKSYARAAELYQSAEKYAEAAEMWLAASEQKRAAEAYEKAERYQDAAALYKELGLPRQAAAMMALLERYAEAGAFYKEAGDIQKAVDMYRLASQPGEAATLMEQAGHFGDAARLYELAGEKEAAARMFKAAGNPVDSARCYLDLGANAEAGELLESSGWLLEAAKAFERGSETMERSARAYQAALRSKVEWRRELTASCLCISVGPGAGVTALGTTARRVEILNDSGETLWRFKPTAGGVPTCVAVSAAGRVAIGCDAKSLYMLDRDKNLLWTYKLPAEAVRLRITPAGDRVLCCTRNNAILCLDGEGTLLWEYPCKAMIWDAAMTEGGSLVATATADGVCLFIGDRRQRPKSYLCGDWAHSVSLSEDGSLCAIGVGMQRVDLVDPGTLKAIWSSRDGSPVHSVLVTPKKCVLSVSDLEAVLRDVSGAVVWRYSAQERLMGGDMDPRQEFAVLRCAGKKVVKVSLHDCRDLAAANYEKAGNFKEAATIHEGLAAYDRAADLFLSAGEMPSAARNMELAGRPEEAAPLYEQAGYPGKAAAIYQRLGQLDKAARLFGQAGELAHAAESLERSGDLAKAAQLFEQAEQYAKAASLYKAAGNIAAAISALTHDVALRPEDLERHLELGLLLQENRQFDTAIQQFQKTVADGKFRRQALIHVAECFVAKNMYGVAIDRYKACLKPGEIVSADNLDVYYGIGKAHELEGNHIEAKRIYESILAIDLEYRDVKQRMTDVEALSGVFAQSHAATPPPGTTLVMDREFQRLSSETKERYAVKKPLGKGGMGTVYLAEDKRLKRIVALKVLPPELASDDQLRARMVREAQAVAQINHPNVVAVFDVGEETGRSYISMEFVDGRTLRDVLKESGYMLPGDCVRLLIQVTEGLGYAHRKGIMHRDIKPENIMVAKDGTAKIMDFGLAIVQGATRLTMPGGVAGTWYYMAPEQVRGEADLTQAVDVYAMGCMTYELLTGTPPFTGSNVGIQHLSEPPRPLNEVAPSLPPSLVAIVMKCLEKNPADRYPDAGSLNAALRNVEHDIEAGALAQTIVGKTG